MNITAATKNPTLSTTICLPRETLAKTLEMAVLTRELNSAEWLADWTPPTMSASQEVL